MDDTLIILNPAAKGDKAARFLEKIKRVTGGTPIRLTERIGDAEVIARDAVKSGTRTVVAAGGDGTINGVVNGIGESGVRLGILPLGTMNVLAAELGLPHRDLGACWKIIQTEKTRRMDLCKMNDRYFIQLAGVGLDAQVVRETDLSFRKHFGPLSYVVTAVQVAGRTPPKLNVSAPDGKTRIGSFVLVGNGRFYGGPFRVFRDAQTDDGLLDVLIFRDLGYTDIARYVAAMAFGGIEKISGVEYFQTPSLRVYGDEAIPVELDGEVDFNIPADFSIAPNPMIVCIP